MVSLTDEQVDFIRKEIESHGISLPDLQANLIDHMCTMIENEMSDNDDFHSFFYSILPRFFHDNLHEIEMETIQLIHQQKFKKMKKTLNFVLAISSIMLLTASVFKIFHFPGTGFLFVGSFGIFISTITPLVILEMKSNAMPSKEKFLNLTISLIVLLFCAGSILKVMHWPFANVCILCSVGFLCLIYAPLYYYLKKQNTKENWLIALQSFLFFITGVMLFMLYDLSKPILP